MLVSAGLAGGGAFFTAKAQIEAQDFDRSISTIIQSKDYYWCGRANGQIINANDGSKHCAIRMEKFQGEEPVE